MKNNTDRYRFAPRPVWMKPACISLIAISVFVLALLSAPALAWDDCPRDIVNDPYPGACGRYVDTNNDGICDHSQSAPTTASSESTAAPAGQASAANDSPPDTRQTVPEQSENFTSVFAAAGAQPPDTSEPPDGTTTAGTALGSSVSPASDQPAVTDPSATSEGSTVDAQPAANGQSAAGGQPGFFTHYMVSPIAIGFFLIYGTSFVLYRTRRMRVSTHRKIWNLLLLATFLVTGIFGIILAIDIDYDLPFAVPRSLLFWHVETGIVMTLISMFHLGWHLNYYRRLLREVANARKRRLLESEERQAVPKTPVSPRRPPVASED